MDPSLTPAEAFTGLKPDVSCMRVFGCVGWAHIHKEIREDASLGDRAVACRFMGMDKLHGTYRVLIGRRKLVRTTNAWFNENAFDVSALGGEEQAKPDAIPLVETPERAVEQAILEAPAQVPTLRTEEEEKHAFQSPAPVRDVRDLGEAATPLASEASEAETIEDPEYQAPEPEGPRRSTRSNRAAVFLNRGTARWIMKTGCHALKNALPRLKRAEKKALTRRSTRTTRIYWRFRMGSIGPLRLLKRLKGYARKARFAKYLSRS